MAAHKNQHFVPRCYLKPFSLNGEGIAINLVNISRGTAIPNAPVKNQCAKNYLHGKGRAEAALAVVEGQYSQVLTRIVDGQKPSVAELNELRFFIFLQSMRTESAVMGARDAINGLNDVIFERSPDLKPADDRSDSEWMLRSLHICSTGTRYVEDLKLVLVKNLTSRGFVTSDNPSTLTNRYHFQRLGKRSFAYMHAGAILAMPLSPQFYALCYDGNVYMTPRATGKHYVEVDKLQDVQALNELQYLSAAENIYFRNWEEREQIVAELAQVATERAKPRVNYFTFVRDEGAEADPNMEMYRRGSRTEELAATESITGFEVQNRSPTHWPSFIKYRPKPKYFTNGTAVGLVRHPEWLTSSR